MKKRVISAIIAGALVMLCLEPMDKVSAAPGNVDEARSEYEQLTANINNLNEEIEKIDGEIAPLVIKMDENKKQIENLDNDINNVNKEIDKAKEKIRDQEDVLSGRLREIYKSGGELSYLDILFTADSLSDLITKISSAKKVVEIDNSMVDKLKDNKEKLDQKVDTLKNKSDEIEKLNNEIAENKKQLEEKKVEEQRLLEEAKVKQTEYDEKYLATAERELVNGLINTVTNANSGNDAIQSSVTQLVALRDSQIKSPTVKEEISNAISKANENIKKNNENSVIKSRGETVSGSAGELLNEAYLHLGKTYVYGATGPDTFDCSGFTSYVYKKVTGMWIGRTTYDQINAGVEVSRSELQPGDLIFPHDSHVAIYIGNGLMIHAPHTGDVVRIAPVYAFWRARRILK